MKVYLAGGMVSGWRDRCAANLRTVGIEIIDPEEHSLCRPVDYVLADMYGVENCDVLLGYMEDSNPSGIGLAFEIGYAKALGKYVFLVCEKNDRYLDIIRCASDRLVGSLREAEAIISRMAIMEGK